METTSSTINKRWKLCIIASLTGCITLILGLNYNHETVISFVALPNAAITVAFADDQFNLSTKQYSEPSPEMVESSISVKNQKGEKCNVFDGKWIYNPKANPLYHWHQCPFLSDQVSCQRNGRPDFDYEKWIWEAKECEISRFNGTDMLEKLRGKRVIIVGDSLNRNQWESLACLLYSAISPSQAHVDVKSGVYKVFKAKDYDCSVEFYWSPFLVQLDVNQAKGIKILSLDKLSASARQWKGADVMVFNTGHWWAHRGKFKAWDLFEYKGKFVEEMEIESAFQMAMKSWASWIDQNINATKTRVFFRSISPEHKGNQWCYNQTQPLIDESYAATFPGALKEIVERAIGEMRTPVQYLNITKLSEYRRDAHPTVYATKEGKSLIKNKQKQPESFADCSHWCLPGLPDTWNKLLYASMVLDNPRHISSS